jgi:hypothetical protein
MATATSPSIHPRELAAALAQAHLTDLDASARAHAKHSHETSN